MPTPMASSPGSVTTIRCLWWSPDPRMVLFTTEVHVSRSLRKTIRSGRLQVTLDNCFARSWRDAPSRDQVRTAPGSRRR